MAVRKRKIKRLRFNALALLLFTFGFLCYVFSSLFVRAYNVSLSKEIQKCNEETVVYQNQNAALSVEIQELSAYDRVMAIASEDQLALYQNNIVTVAVDKE